MEMVMMAQIEINLTVNGVQRTLTTEPHRSLLYVLRDDLQLTGTKEACGQGDCGACVVVLDGEAVNSCLVLAPQAEGSEVLTVEGLTSRGEPLTPLQRAFAEKYAFQCGFCTSGMLMSSYALLLHNSDPSEEDIQSAISGNLCRCTGYVNIVEAIQQAAVEIRELVVDQKVGTDG
jgi:aerobic carbon-monoxide dehydrogenase small subunit